MVAEKFQGMSLGISMFDQYNFRRNYRYMIMDSADRKFIKLALVDAVRRGVDLSSEKFQNEFLQIDDPETILNYVILLNRRCPKAEPYIMEDPSITFRYAKEVIKDRWPEAEPIIAKDPCAWYLYTRFLGVIGRDVDVWRIESWV